MGHGFLGAKAQVVRVFSRIGTSDRPIAKFLIPAGTEYSAHFSTEILAGTEISVIVSTDTGIFVLIKIYLSH